jgi:ankyrin repeat protein/L-ascorbate metabolism protein UlaG (beta-lactamase superfamily)/Tol biopolymer transport system component
MNKIAFLFIMTVFFLIPVWPDEIHEAAQKGDVEKVHALLQQNSALVDARDEFDRTPLHWAVRGVHFELMQLLIEKGADINAKDNARITPLHSVASRGHKQAAELLIAKGADLTAEDTTGNTPLSYSVSGGHREVGKLLLDHGVHIPLQGEEARKLLHLAASSGNKEFVDLMIAEGVDTSLKNDEGGKLLHSAVHSGNSELVKSLIERGEDVNEKNGHDITPIHIAAFYGHEEIAQLLLKNGADINAENKISLTALSFAEFGNKKEMIELLIERGADRKSPHLTDLLGEYFGQKKPGSDPEPFADGILHPIMSLQSAPSFAPDGKEVYWSTFFGPPFRLLIIVMQKKNGRWMTPQIAPFSSDEHFSFNPVFSPDGERLYFISNRPLKKNGKPQGFNNWFVERQGVGWSEPKHHGLTVNSNDEWGSSITKDEVLYFASGREGSMGATDIFRSRLVNGQYAEPENLGVSINTKGRELYPFVAPDESYLLFISNRSAGEYGGTDQYFDIYISFRRPDTSWTTAKKMCDGINSDTFENTPIVSPDGKYLFFVSQRKSNAGDAYWIDAEIIEELKPDELKPDKKNPYYKNPVVCIHYLGHASFILEFDNGVTVLTDYGKSRSYGLDSPICGMGVLKPDVVTYSHQHEDHAGGVVPADISHVLKGGENLNLKGISISPIPTFERSLEKPDNFSYLFTYKGIKILHMGDCQALITGMDLDLVGKRVKQMYPDVYDLVMLPIGFVNDIVHPAAEFAVLLRAKRLIPMHYWSAEEKANFLSLIKDKKNDVGIAYSIDKVNGAKVCLPELGDHKPFVRVYDLDPWPFTPTMHVKRKKREKR